MHDRTTYQTTCTKTWHRRVVSLEPALQEHWQRFVTSFHASCIKWTSQHVAGNVHCCFTFIGIFLTYSGFCLFSVEVWRTDMFICVYKLWKTLSLSQWNENPYIAHVTIHFHSISLWVVSSYFANVVSHFRILFLKYDFIHIIPVNTLCVVCSNRSQCIKIMEFHWNHIWTNNLCVYELNHGNLTSWIIEPCNTLHHQFLLFFAV